MEHLVRRKPRICHYEEKIDPGSFDVLLQDLGCSVLWEQPLERQQYLEEFGLKRSEGGFGDGPFDSGGFGQDGFRLGAFWHMSILVR